MRRLLPTALIAVLVGCTGAPTTITSAAVAYPVGPSLAELGVRERCTAEDQSCQDRAHEMLRAIVADLGDPATDPAIQAPDDSPPDGRLFVIFDAEPPFEWHAADGASGTAAHVAVDLTLVHLGGQAYAVVGPGQAYEVDRARAEDLLFALFVLAA